MKTTTKTLMAALALSVVSLFQLGTAGSVDWALSTDSVDWAMGTMSVDWAGAASDVLNLGDA